MVQQDSDIYKYYPSGLITAISKLGGLLAILNVGVILSFLHKRWFNKEINQVISQSKILPLVDKEEENGTKRGI